MVYQSDAKTRKTLTCQRKTRTALHKRTCTWRTRPELRLGRTQNAPYCSKRKQLNVAFTMLRCAGARTPFRATFSAIGKLAIKHTAQYIWYNTHDDVSTSTQLFRIWLCVILAFLLLNLLFFDTRILYRSSTAAFSVIRFVESGTRVFVRYVNVLVYIKLSVPCVQHYTKSVTCIIMQSLNVHDMCIQNAQPW